MLWKKNMLLEASSLVIVITLNFSTYCAFVNMDLKCFQQWLSSDLKNGMGKMWASASSKHLQVAHTLKDDCYLHKHDSNHLYLFSTKTSSPQRFLFAFNILFHLFQLKGLVKKKKKKASVKILGCVPSPYPHFSG